MFQLFMFLFGGKYLYYCQNETNEIWTLILIGFEKLVVREAELH